MRKPILALGLAALVPALAIHAQSTRERPTSLDKDCGDCHAGAGPRSGRQVPSRSTGFRLRPGQASCRAVTAR
jgi:hypothetical protein